MRKKSIVALFLTACILTSTACSNTIVIPEDQNNSSLADVVIDRGNEVKIDVQGLDGRPFIPGGSAITASAAVLGYYGVSIDPTKLRAYAPIVEGTSFVDGTESPWDKLIGNPKGTLSFYFAPPIIKMLKDFYADNESKCKGRTVKDVSGADLEALKGYVDQNKPIVVWGTITGNAAVPVEDYTWITDKGDEFVGKMSPRCYTMIGYNNSEVILISDNGKTLNVMTDTFVEMYTSMESQAILIE